MSANLTLFGFGRGCTCESCVATNNATEWVNPTGDRRYTGKDPYYTEKQYSTPSAMQMIRDKFLPERGPDGYTKHDIECAAQYMSKTLRIGGLRTCRALVLGAIEKGE